MKTRRLKRRRRPLSAWQQSTAFRMMASQAITAFNRKRQLLPKCGASAKSTGEPCRNPAMGNGRCHVHGGKTPSGNGWHQPLWPKGSPRAMEKADAKIAKRQREASRRKRRLAAMTPEQRVQHDHWQATHKPGSAGARAIERENRRHGREAFELFSRPAEHKPPNPEVDAIQAEIDRLTLELERRRAAANKPSYPNTGVFE